MRPRTVLVLALLVAALLAFIWFYERELPSSEERAEMAQRLLSLEAEEVHAVELVWQEREVRLERSQEAATGEWRLVSPLVARADGDKVDRLIDDLVSLEHRRELRDVAAAELGLDPPRARVRIETGESTQEIRVGSEVPASGSMIVALGADEPLYVVDDRLWPEFTQEPGEWRSRDVFPATREEIDRVTLEASGTRLLLARRGEEFWLESPLSDRADEDGIRELLSEITGLRVEAFLDEPSAPLSELGLAPPRGRVEVALRERKEPFRLELGDLVEGEEGQRYARADDQLLATRTELQSTLQRSAEEWRSLSWAGLEAYQIDSIEVAAGEGVLVLSREGADWERDGEKIPYSAASDLLYALTGARAEQVTDRSESLGEPVMEFVLRGSSGEETLALYASEASGTPATTGDREALLLLSAATVAEIEEKLEAVRGAEAETQAADPAASE